MSLDSIYYSNFEPETQHEFLNNPFEESLSITPISEAVSEIESTEAELKINLNLSLAQTLLGLDTAIYSSNDNWLEYFPGIVVNSMSGHGASGFDLSSGLSVMRIHYHNDTDTTQYDYVIGPTSSRINMFSNDYVSDLDDLYTFNPDSKASTIELSIEIGTSTSFWINCILLASIAGSSANGIPALTSSI